MQFFFQSAGCLFTFFIVSFDAQNVLLYMKSNWSIFSFVACIWSIISKNLLPNLRLWRLTPTIFCSVSPLIKNYFIFFMSEKDLFCLHIFKILFFWIKNSRLTAFSPPVFSRCCFTIMLYLFLTRNLSSLFLFFYTKIYSFALPSFNILFSIILSNLIKTSLAVVFFIFRLLGFIYILETKGL